MSVESKPVATTNKPKKAVVADAILKSTRLPCRGCEASCKNYDVCEGKPWRVFR